MATTTNFGWTTPDDTDLVKDGASAIRTLGSAIDTSLVDLKGGTTGQVLSKASGSDMDFTWTTAGSSFAGASVTSSGNQSATQYVLTAITWDSENFDTDAFHDNATNNSRITIPAGKGGYYQVNARAGCGPNGGRWEVYIYKNGSQYQATRLLNSEQPAPQISVVMSLTAGDYIEVYGYPESSTPTIYKGKYGDFSVAYLGA